MTTYEDIIDLALMSIEDYRLNNLARYMSEDDFDIIYNSSSYEDYVEACDRLGISPFGELKYNKIVDAQYASYIDYVEESLMKLVNAMEGFLIRGLPNFTNCVQDLSNRDDAAKTFNLKLTDLEQSILADWTVVAWLDREINDVTQITGMMQNKVEAHRYSEASLLKEKTFHKVKLQEDINKKQTDYGLLNVPWKDWARGNYGI